MDILLNGGVTSALGYTAAGIKIGLKESGNRDLALIYSKEKAVSAGTFTRNLVKAAPVVLSEERIKAPYTQAVIINSGNANACTGDLGYKNAKKMSALVAKELEIDEDAVLISSTGIIGVQLPMEKIESGVIQITDELSKEEGGKNVVKAIMTTDTKEKQIAVQFKIDDQTITIGGIAKGSGMIHPNMGTMLAFLTTDIAIEKSLLEQIFLESVEDSYNMVSVDGDTSTNDTGIILANGMAGNPCISTPEDKGYREFKEALDFINKTLAKKIAEDGEGATKLIEVTTFSARTLDDAKKVAKSVIGSSLVKSAIFGSDANWGRILCAIGYSGATLDVNKIEIFARHDTKRVQIAKEGTGVTFDETLLSDIFKAPTINIDIYLHDGDASAVAWGCDLTYDYVKINADYRT